MKRKSLEEILHITTSIKKAEFKNFKTNSDVKKRRIIRPHYDFDIFNCHLKKCILEKMMNKFKKYDIICENCGKIKFEDTNIELIVNFSELSEKFVATCKKCNKKISLQLKESEVIKNV